MKKLLFAVIFGMLVSGVALAANMRDPVATTSTGTQVNANFPGESNYAYVHSWGNGVAGNPGYIGTVFCDAHNACFPYYLWVASDGNLYGASYLTISAFTSFPSGNWNRSSMAVGSKIGSQ